MLIVLVGVVLLFFDFSYAAVSQLLLENGASRVARADTVGFNDFQRAKSLRVSMIPVSGARTVPDENAVASEQALLRTYLQSENWAEANGILNYERWSTLTHEVSHSGNRSEVEVQFVVPKMLPNAFAALFGIIPGSGDTQTLRATWAIEDHASLYLSR